MGHHGSWQRNNTNNKNKETTKQVGQERTTKSNNAINYNLSLWYYQICFIKLRKSKVHLKLAKL